MVEMHTIRDLLPHYLAVLVLVVLTTTLVRLAIGVNVALEFVLVLGVVAAYVVLTRRLGYAPEQWQ